MKATYSHIAEIFDRFPEPVFLIEADSILYRNSAAALRYPDMDKILIPVVSDLLASTNTQEQNALTAGGFLISCTKLPEGLLLMLRPNAYPAVGEPYSSVPAQLRMLLSSLFAATERLHSKIGSQELIATQTQSLYRMLRLTRQLELGQEDWAAAYPMHRVNLVSLCQNLYNELHDRLQGEAMSLSFETSSNLLLLEANRALLEQLILSLLSNAIKHSGLSGQIGFRLSEKGGRAIVSIWDNGPGISDQQLFQLFTPQLQSDLFQPKSGLGLDLWIAQRIATLHNGVLIAGNRPEGGAEFTLSLPIAVLKDMNLRSPDLLLAEEGMPSMLVGLADVLPSHVFSASWE